MTKLNLSLERYYAGIFLWINRSTGHRWVWTLNLLDVIAGIYTVVPWGSLCFSDFRDWNLRFYSEVGNDIKEEQKVAKS